MRPRSTPLIGSLAAGMAAGLLAGLAMNLFARATLSVSGREAPDASPGADRTGRGMQPPQAKGRAEDDKADREVLRHVSRDATGIGCRIARQADQDFGACQTGRTPQAVVLGRGHDRHYSNRSASIGSVAAALDAGYQPKKMPMPAEKAKAMSDAFAEVSVGQPSSWATASASR